MRFVGACGGFLTWLASFPYMEIFKLLFPESQEKLSVGFASILRCVPPRSSPSRSPSHLGTVQSRGRGTEMKCGTEVKTRGGKEGRRSGVRQGQDRILPGIPRFQNFPEVRTRKGFLRTSWVVTQMHFLLKEISQSGFLMSSTFSHRGKISF